MNKTAIEIGDQVTFPGYNDPQSVDYGTIGTVVELREFLNASDDDTHLSALVEETYLGKVHRHYCPVCYLKKYRNLSNNS